MQRHFWYNSKATNASRPKKKEKKKSHAGSEKKVKIKWAKKAEKTGEIFAFAFSGFSQTFVSQR